jgi:hypothetical protein
MQAVKARVPAGWPSPPAEPRKKYGQAHTSDAPVLPTIDQVVAEAQALSQNLVAGATGASVEDFLAGRACEAEAE